MFTSNSNGTLLPFVKPSQKFEIMLSSTGKTQSHKKKTKKKQRAYSPSVPSR